jgi:hypothetical protein
MPRRKKKDFNLEKEGLSLEIFVERFKIEIEGRSPEI